MEDIIKWLTSSELNYKEGIEIFSRFCKNQILVRGFMFGRPQSNLKKLEYEMKLLLKIPVKAIFNQKCSNQQLINQFLFKKIPALEKTIQNKTNVTIANHKSILEAKELLKDLSTKISIKHNSLYECGEGNDSKTIALRNKLLKEREPLIHRYEALYKAKEECFILGKITDELIDLIKKDTVFDNSPDDVDFNKLSDIELLKTKNRLLTTITKTKNKIFYQSDTKSDKKNPLPNGPKKDRLIKKLEILQKQYNEVFELIKKREKNAR